MAFDLDNEELKATRKLHNQDDGLYEETSDKNVANIEDDVKIVKRYLENSAYKESDSDFFKNGGWEMVDLEIPRAMQNILAEREQDKKRIKELEEEIAMLKRASNIAKEVNIEDVTDVINKSCKEFMSNYIPKQAAIEALEDIKDYFDRLNGPDEDIEYIRQVKEELLEGGK